MKGDYHDIVVAQSRSIYESLVDEEDFTEEVSNDKSKGFIKGIKKDVDAEEEGVEESSGKKGIASRITTEEAKELMDWIDTGEGENEPVALPFEYDEAGSIVRPVNA